MKKALLLCTVLTMACLLSACVRQEPPSPPQTPPAEDAAATGSSSADAELESAAAALLQSMKAGDFSAVADWVDPQVGVTFTPYSTVDFSVDLCLSSEEVSFLGTDPTLRTWGIYDGSGEPMELTGQAYWDQFVWNTDYTEAPNVSIHSTMQQGNSPENAGEAYPYAPGTEEGQFSYVEYHFDGLDPAYGGADWCALKVVFLRRDGAWRLIGVVHSEMTL